MKKLKKTKKKSLKSRSIISNITKIFSSTVKFLGNVVTFICLVIKITSWFK
jgi:hypothetical protein